MAVFLSGAVNMTEPEVQKAIAEFTSQHTSVTYNKSAPSAGDTHTVHVTLCTVMSEAGLPSLCAG